MQFLFQLPNFYASWFGIVATLLVTSTKLLYMKPDDATNIHVCMGKLPWCVSDYWQWFWPPRKKKQQANVLHYRTRDQKCWHSDLVN